MVIALQLVGCPFVFVLDFTQIMHNEKLCVLFKVKMYSYVLPLQNKLSAEDCP